MLLLQSKKQVSQVCAERLGSLSDRSTELIAFVYASDINLKNRNTPS